MKPLLLSTNDIEGGAARAAYRLHQSLRAIAIPSQMLVQNKDSADPSVVAQKSAAYPYDFTATAFAPTSRPSGFLIPLPQKWLHCIQI
jgi:hypothetical protein